MKPSTSLLVCGVIVHCGLCLALTPITNRNSCLLGIYFALLSLSLSFLFSLSRSLYPSINPKDIVAIVRFGPLGHCSELFFSAAMLRTNAKALNKYFSMLCCEAWWDCWKRSTNAVWDNYMIWTNIQNVIRVMLKVIIKDGFSCHRKCADLIFSALITYDERQFFFFQCGPFGDWWREMAEWRWSGLTIVVFWAFLEYLETSLRQHFIKFQFNFGTL